MNFDAADLTRRCDAELAGLNHRLFAIDRAIERAETTPMHSAVRTRAIAKFRGLRRRAERYVHEIGLCRDVWAELAERSAA